MYKNNFDWFPWLKINFKTSWFRKQLDSFRGCLASSSAHLKMVYKAVEVVEDQLGKQAKSSLQSAKLFSRLAKVLLKPVQNLLSTS